MLADAENLILPALLVIFVLYPASFWILVRSFGAKNNFLTKCCAVVILLISGTGLALLAMDFVLEPQWNVLSGVLFWGIPFFAATVTLIRLKRLGK